MSPEELLALVRTGEDSHTEFKTEDVHPQTLAEEIVAFANFKGGRILVGVDDGEGILRMIRYCRESGPREPELALDDPQQFRVAFFRRTG